MSDLPKPLFLERQSYRRRRIIDACLLLPVFGGFLFMIPLLWETQAGPDYPILAQKGLYIFAVWFALVFASAVLSRVLRAGGTGKWPDTTSTPPEITPARGVRPRLD